MWRRDWGGLMISMMGYDRVSRENKLEVQVKLHRALNAIPHLSYNNLSA